MSCAFNAVTSGRTASPHVSRSTFSEPHSPPKLWLKYMTPRAPWMIPLQTAARICAPVTAGRSLSPNGCPTSTKLHTGFDADGETSDRTCSTVHP